MKNDVNDKEFIKKRTQNIKYMLLKEFGYDNGDLKIDIIPTKSKNRVDALYILYFSHLIANLSF